MLSTSRKAHARSGAANFGVDGLASQPLAAASPAVGATNAMVNPRIYYLNPLLCGPLDGWAPHLDRIAGMGFDHVLIAPIFAPDSSGDLFAPGNLSALHPALREGSRPAAGDIEGALSYLAGECRLRGLSLLVDLTPRLLQCAAVGSSVEPDVGTNDERRRDPRRSPSRSVIFPGDLVAANDGRARKILRSWIECGVAGFRCLHLQDLPPAQWREVALSVPEAMLLAWTPGLTHEAIAAFAGCGFAATFSSLPWWDYRSPWLAAEDAVLRQVAPPVAPVSIPFGDEPGGGARSERAWERAARRLIATASTIGSGLLMPMGFEFGARRPFDSVRDRPQVFAALMRNARLDLRDAIAAANACVRDAASHEPLRLLSSPHAAVAALGHAENVRERRLLAINASLDRHVLFDPVALTARLGLGRIDAKDQAPESPGTIRLGAGECRELVVSQPETPPGTLSEPDAALRAPRIAIEAIAPSIDGGRFAVKRTVGERIEVEADIFADGHGLLAAKVCWEGPGGSHRGCAAMQPVVNDRWQGTFVLERLGRYRFWIEAWVDTFATFRDELAKKSAAGRDVRLELQEGRQLVLRALERAPDGAKNTLRPIGRALEQLDESGQVALFIAPATAVAMGAADDRPFLARSPHDVVVEVERLQARYASWYEIFPRSHAPRPGDHGRLVDVIAQLPRIRALGFDVLYFPPIHPIGLKNRKGRNNSLVPQADDPGSPYAIGSSAGGHDAIEPSLGTLDDFRQLQTAARAHGLEIAIDFAIQCSPDHPWLGQHPDWFAWRPDGSLRYAENPPKKYEDIVNVDFYAHGGKPELWRALRDVVLFWAEHGVRTFRVDNPHTKPLPFWEWLISDVRSLYPDTVFLSEAFTRPKMMNRLAKLGFSQSYTYFTWRNEKAEIEAYFRELTQGPPRDFLRPHLFVNTPDINPVFLQTSGRPGHLIRAVLAATLSGLWGVYSGFELCEAAALPDREEYLDSEKYQLRRWDWGRPGNIEAEIAMLNAVRRSNPALQTHLGLSFLTVWNDRVVCYEKATSDRDNVVLVIVSLDPHEVQEADFECPLWAWGLPDHAAVTAEDLIGGGEETWQGKPRHVRLEPQRPFGLWRLRVAGAGT